MEGSTTFTPSQVKLDVTRLEPEEQLDSDKEMEPSPLPALNLAWGCNLVLLQMWSLVQRRMWIGRCDDGLFLMSPNRCQSGKERPRIPSILIYKLYTVEHRCAYYEYLYGNHPNYHKAFFHSDGGWIGKMWGVWGTAISGLTANVMLAHHLN